jgi:hypothetical protein
VMRAFANRLVLALLVWVALVTAAYLTGVT